MDGQRSGSTPLGRLGGRCVATAAPASVIALALGGGLVGVGGAQPSGTVFGQTCTVVANLQSPTPLGGWTVSVAGSAPLLDASATQGAPPIPIGPAAAATGAGEVICVAGSLCRSSGRVDAVLVGTPEDDVIFGSVCDDLILGGGGADTIYGVLGDDTVVGGPGRDSLSGGFGDDELFGGADDDTLHGDLGDDTAFGGSGEDVLNGEAGDDCLVGGTGADELYGWAGRDLLSGGADADFVQGNDHADVLLGGPGSDTVRGNDGADNLFGDSAMDLADDGGYGDEIAALDGSSATATTLAAAIDGATAWFDGDPTMDCVVEVNSLAGARDSTGGYVGWPLGVQVPATFDDDLRGGGGDDVIRGEAGDDTVFGDDGNDTVFGEGNTACSEAGGFDVDGDSMADCLVPATGLVAGSAGLGLLDEAEVDYRHAAGDDSVSGNAGDDRVYGGGGNDVVRGQADDDVLEGGNSTRGGITDLDDGTPVPGGGYPAGTDLLIGGTEWDACDPALGFVESCEIVASFF